MLQNFGICTGRKCFKTHHRSLSWCPNNLAFAEKVAWKAVLIAKLFELHLFCRLWEQPENQFVICTVVCILVGMKFFQDSEETKNTSS